MKFFMRFTPPTPTALSVPVGNGKVMYDALTGMRFVAALVVFLAHFRSRFETQLPLLNADVAVGFFFMLSGFILTHAYRGGIAPGSRTRFYVARFARIWPLHAVCLIAFYWVVVKNVLPDTGPAWMRFLATAALLQSWSTDQRFIIQLNGASWSLSVEAFLYAVFPLLIVLNERRFTRAYLGIAAGTALALILGEQLVARSFVDMNAAGTVIKFIPAMRLLEFVSGIAAARWMAERRERKAGSMAHETAIDLLAIGSLVVADLLIGHFGWMSGLLTRSAPVSMRFLGTGFGYGLAFAFLFTRFSCSRGLVAMLLSNRIAVFLGEISFAVYVVHASVQIAFKQSAWAKGVDWRITLAVSLAATLAASTVLHLWVEKPARELILALWERRLRAQWPALRGQWLSVRGNVPAVASLALLALCPWAIRTAGSQPLDTAKVAAGEPAVQTDAPVRDPGDISGVVFQGEARIVSADALQDKERFQLNLEFLRLPSAKRNMFVHVVGSDGKVVRQLTPRFETVRRPDGTSMHRASVDEPDSKLAGGVRVGIGFWKKGLETVPADRGPRSMGGHRLDIYQIPSRIGGLRRSVGHAENASAKG